jgi:hypothetical protein
VNVTASALARVTVRAVFTFERKPHELYESTRLRPWEPLNVRVPARNDRDEFLAVKHSGNWYDFTVRVIGQEAFARRFAGRVETGRHSLSDPAMGGRARGEQG